MRAAIAGSQATQQTTPRLLKILEAWLQLRQAAWPSTGLSLQMAKEFTGALYSPDFIELQMDRRYIVARLFGAMLDLLCTAATARAYRGEADIRLVPTPFVKECAAVAGAQSLSEERKYFWHGWMATNLTGRSTWFPLHRVYTQLGRKFTDHLFGAATTYFEGRRAQRIPGFFELCRFLGGKSADVLPRLANEHASGALWREFCRFYFTTGIKDSEVTTLVRNWRAEFLPFAEDYLVRRDLIAKPLSGFPTPPVHPAKPTNVVSVRGREMSLKLLTPIPLYVSDEEALELLFKRIEDDVSRVRTWAMEAIDDLDHRVSRRSNATSGSARTIGPRSKANGGKYLTDARNPAHLANAAATFRLHGFQTRKDTVLGLLYPRPLSYAAHEMGMPYAGALLPHCAALTAMHPEITPSYLENFLLFDRHGHQSGVAAKDGVTYLDGLKERRGKRKAQQPIALTPASLSVVTKIIRATKPARDYLRARGDDNWRYLLLSTGPGFAYPRPVRRLATFTSRLEDRDAIVRALKRTWNVPASRRRHLVDNFSLPALRASVGVLIYIKTLDPAKMAAALGHTTYSRGLLDRYLPRSLREFFEERWLRLFQEGVILEAMKDSQYLLEASSFSSMEEVREFLKHHSLKRIATPAEAMAQAVEGNAPEALVEVSADSLAVMLALRSAVTKRPELTSGQDRYWAAFGERLSACIDSGPREDLKDLLASARSKAPDLQIEDLISAG